MNTKLITLLAIGVTIVSTATAQVNVSNINAQIQQTEATLSNLQSLAKSAAGAIPTAVSNLDSSVKSATSNLTTKVSAANTNSTASTNAPSKTKETINDAVVDILHGAKSASGEIYQASKQAITKAVDFTMEQAPLVVKEFLHWKIAEAIIRLIAWSIIPIVLLCIARNFYKRSQSPDVPKEDRSKTDQNDYAILKWLFRVMAWTWLAINLMNYGMVITKIAVAPRVYLIEYVVDTVHNGGVPPADNR